MNYKEYDTKPQKLTRTEAYGAAWKDKWKQLLLMGMLLTFALAPIVIFRYDVLAHQMEMLEAVEQNKLTEAQAQASVYSLKNVFFVASLVMALLVAVVCAGIAKACKCISWSELTSVKDNFGEGIKENSLRFCICFLGNALFLRLCGFVIDANGEDVFWRYFPYGVYFLLVLPWSLWFVACTAMYKGGFFGILRNAFALMCGHYFSTVSFMALFMLPLVLMVIPVMWAQLVLALYGVYFPYVYLGWVYYTNGIFDRHINREKFPELVDRGLE